MKHAPGSYALMLSVMLWGVLLGGVVYSHIVFFPVYLSDLPASSVVVNGQYGLDESRFWLLIHPVLVLSLVVALVANWGDNVRRKLIGATLTVYVIIIVISAIFFIPELGAFKNSPQSDLTPQQWFDRSQRWQHLSWIRGATLFVFAIPLLFALARPYKKPDENS